MFFLAKMACIIESATSSDASISSLGNSIFELFQKGVSIAPGWNDITFILDSLNSSLRLDENPVKPNLDATYADE